MDSKSQSRTNRTRSFHVAEVIPTTSTRSTSPGHSVAAVGSPTVQRSSSPSQSDDNDSNGRSGDSTDDDVDAASTTFEEGEDGRDGDEFPMASRYEGNYQSF